MLKFIEKFLNLFILGSLSKEDIFSGVNFPIFELLTEPEVLSDDQENTSTKVYIYIYLLPILLPYLFWFILYSVFKFQKNFVLTLPMVGGSLLLPPPLKLVAMI
jgi:hypothetical protein